MTISALQDPAYEIAVAIVGMAGRFPDAPGVEQLWDNLVAAKRSIRIFSDDELLAAGVEPVQLQQPNYIKAGTVVADVERFDAGFFGYPPREAEVMDPQHRMFLECAWEALERAAYDPESFAGPIGVFAGSSFPWYLGNNISTHPELEVLMGRFQIELNANVDSLATRVSYKLNLRGPSVSVQTFCSTSLVAVHLACQSLITYECDLALAGGVAVAVPHGTGYLYQEGGIVSPDGSCRSFDARAQGSVMGSGLGVVALRRLEDALLAGDHIHAIIRGSAVNNDGIRKVGYTAPGVAGQSAVILQALARAGLSADQISYIEAHGTATPLGDSVELSAMIKAFQQATARKQFCAIGSVKPNIGHLDRAAGVTGLIKASLALEHGQLPPSLDFESPSPDIDLANSPFYVNTRLADWPVGEEPRRAGVSSFGIGGTNAHVVLEEAPAREPSGVGRPYQLLLVSAKTETALETATANLVAHCRAQPELEAADVAFTLQVGRSAFGHRRAVVCRDLADGLAALEALDPRRVLTTHRTSRDRPVAFVFAGVGDHYPGMARELYQTEPTFRRVVDQCCEQLIGLVGQDLRQVVYATPDRDGAVPDRDGAVAGARDLRALLGRDGRSALADQPLRRTSLAQPSVFVIEYALAQLLREWGIEPQAMLGYSLGEYVAACLAGVFSLEDGLRLVAKRAQLIEALPAGAMLAVALSEADVQPWLDQQVCLASVNSPSMSVLAGPVGAIAALERSLAAQDVATRRLETGHAFHSTMLEPAAEALTELAATLELRPPRIPYVSDVSGTWITAAEATDPSYWARHMCQTVQFAAGVEQLLQDPALALLELGPGQTLTSFVKQHPACSRERLGLVLASLPSVYEPPTDLAYLLGALARLWLAGVSIDWHGFSCQQRRHRLQLPTYPFERQRFWIEPWVQPESFRREGTSQTASTTDRTQRRPDSTSWFAAASWQRTHPLDAADVEELCLERQCWLVLVDDTGVGVELASWLSEHNQEVVTVSSGATFACLDTSTYAVRPTVRADYEAVLAELRAQGKTPSQVVHLWTVPSASQLADATAADEVARQLDWSFYSLMALTQALGDQLGTDNCRITIVSSELQQVTGSERLCPAKAAVIGYCKVIGLEYLNLTCRSIDIALPETGAASSRLVRQLAGELLVDTDDMVALRGSYRWLQSYEPIRLPAAPLELDRLRVRGVYLITGGLGGIGLGMADYLAAAVQARLVLVGRTGLPPRDQWPQILAEQGAEAGVGRRIHLVQQLEARGAEVLVVEADVTDARQMRDAVEHALARFGIIHGVLHAAGVPGIGLLQLKAPQTAAAVLAPKVQGTLALAAALSEVRLDFLALWSSVTSALGGGPGQVDYCAANAFMDLYAQQHAGDHDLVVSISWGEWLWDAWQEGLLGFPEATRAELIANRKTYGLSFEEGAEALRRIVARQLPHVFVSTRDLQGMVADMRNATAKLAYQRFQEGREAQPLYPRPVLGTLYVAPRTPLEEKIAAIWGAVLGIDQIGVEDNFFELGGNS
ncbi:MAG: SDR family NAD(P)-dependent oxidoreductase, partial [Chloroflexi bacterium]|nr:SDR family NAD(P)-dependent oxidoreductase [Chloroflexota bacterium]